MMQWINVRDRLPKPNTPCWVYWKNREVLIGCRTYVGEEEFSQPPNEGWYSYEDEKCRNLDWWMPIEKPEKPNV